MSSGHAQGVGVQSVGSRVRKLLLAVPYVQFYLEHPRVLSFGILLTLFSSFGQTFLISIFVPKMLETFSLTTVQFGSLYAAATVSSALCLPFLGKLVDRVHVGRYSLAVGLGLMVACFTVGLAPSVPILFAGIVGLRLTGQGLLTLTAATTMARVFADRRGKALSVSALGYPLGEGLLPLGVVLLINALGWRVSWGLLGMFIGLVLLPLIVQLVKGFPDPDEQVASATHSNEGQTHATTTEWTRRKILGDWRFYAIVPGSLLLPFILTGLFLYQVPLGEFKGWTAERMAAGFIGFAAARFAFSLVVGPLIDRWGAVRLFPYYVLPLAGGLVALHLGSQSWVAIVYLGLAGVSVGMSSSIMTALWAELYGVSAIGSLKGIVSMLGVLSTALAPVVLGWLLDAGVSFGRIVPVAIYVIAGSVVVSAVVSRRVRLAIVSANISPGRDT